MQYLMVLNDGQTYSPVNNTSIIQVPDDFDDNDIEAFLDTLNTDTADPFVATFTVNADNGVCVETPDALGPRPLRAAPAAPASDDDFMRRMLAAFPNAQVEEDSDGQLVVHTGLKQVNGRVVAFDAE